MPLRQYLSDTRQNEMKVSNFGQETGGPVKKVALLERPNR